MKNGYTGRMIADYNYSRACSMLEIRFFLRLLFALWCNFVPFAFAFRELRVERPVTGPGSI